MAITWADKNRNAAVDTPESQISDDDMNAIKSEINVLDGIVTGSATIVSSKADFPDAVAGVITLTAGVSYRIAGAVNLGTDRIVTNGANLVGLSLFADSLTYTGTGTMLTITSVNFDCKNLTISAVNGTLLDVTGTSANRVLFNSVLTDSDTFGNVADIQVFEYSQGNLNVATAGLTFSGTPIAIIINSTGFSGLSGSGTYLDFGTAVFAVGGDMQTVRSTVATGETFMSGLANGANFGIGLTMSGGFFGGAGTILNNITSNDENINFTGNHGINDTDHRAMVYVAQGAEAVTTITGGDGDLGNPKRIAGTFTEQIAQRWTTEANGRLTYHNGTTVEYYRFTATLTIEPTAGTNNIYHFYIAKNGVVDVHTAAHIQVDVNDPEQITIQGDLSATDGDYFEIFAEDQVGTQDFQAQNVNFGVDN
jgi:hypothetical protein